MTLVRNFSVFFLLIYLHLFSIAFAATSNALPNSAKINSSLPSTLTIKILAINDFHGQINQGQKVNNRPVGGAAVLASYLHQAELGMDDRTLIALIGDQVGASPAPSGLLADKPTMLFLNQLGNKYCRSSSQFNPKCNVIATIGNHEFDAGVDNMLRSIYGGLRKPTLSWTDNYSGPTFPYISANITYTKTGKLLFPPYLIQEIDGIKIAFIGAILKNAPAVILASRVAGITFLDEAKAINRYIPEIKKKGVKIIIVMIHQGGEQSSYEGTTLQNSHVAGEIVDIVKHLDDAVDVVLSGHSHEFTNAYLNNKNGKKILVTQAFCYSKAFAEIILEIDRQTQIILKKYARIITTFADEGPGLHPDPRAQTLVKYAEHQVAAKINKYIATLKETLFVSPNEAGESALGNLIADSMRFSLRADMAMLPIGGIRTNLYAGKITWGSLYAVQPFQDHLIKMQLSGKDIYDLLEQQWINQPWPRFLQISGFSYTWDASKPVGHHIIEVLSHHQPIKRDQVYTIATDEYLATGGDNFSVMKQGKVIEIGPIDLDGLIHYIQALPQPFSAKIDGRIKKIT